MTIIIRENDQFEYIRLDRDSWVRVSKDDEQRDAYCVRTYDESPAFTGQKQVGTRPLCWLDWPHTEERHFEHVKERVRA